MNTINRSLITIVILLSLLVLILVYFLILFRSKYINLLAIKNSRKNKKHYHHQQQEEDLDNNDEEDGIVDNSKNDRQEKQLDKIREKRKLHESLEFSEGDYDENISEITASNNGDIEIGQPKYSTRNDEFNSAKNDVELAKPNYITRWRNKIHKSSKNAKYFMKRFLTNNDNGTKALLKNYESTGKLSPTNSLNSLDEPTKENIIIPCSMIPEINRGVIRFSNNANNGSFEPLQYLTLNTSELERDNFSTAEEFRIKSFRIINSPR